MSNIRETYSGLISFLTSLFTLITGLAYMLIITRALSTYDYGTWGIINSLFAYGLIFSSIPAFWLVRETARESNTEKTGIISSFIWSGIGLASYFIAAVVFSEINNVDVKILMLAGVLIPVNIFQKIVSAINLGWKPQLNSFGILAAQIVLIPLTLLFVSFYNLGLTGVIFALLISVLANIAIQLYALRSRLNNIFDFSIIKKWFKFSWVQLYPKIATVLYTTDVLIFASIIGSSEIISYYFVAVTFANIVSNSQGITQAIYPKILAGAKGKFISRNITYLLFFTCPLISIAIVFAKPGIVLLNPIYFEAYILAIILSFKIFFNMLTEIFEQFIIGNERVDVNKYSTLKNYLRSTLIVIPTLRIIQYSVYLIMLSGIILFYVDSKSNQELLVYWVIMATIAQIPLLTYLAINVKKTFSIKLESKNIMKYITSSIIAFGIVSFFVKDVNVSLKFFELLPQILLFVTIGVVLYIIISLILDRVIRNLLFEIISEIKRKIQK